MKWGRLWLVLVILLMSLDSFVTDAAPGVALYKRIDLSDNPVADARMTIGDLDGDGQIDFVFNDGRRMLKAFDSEGNLLWEKFNPDDPGVEQPHHNFTIQNYDIDQDGKDEVICYWEVEGRNELVVLDGVTGQIEASVELPFPPPRDHEPWGNTSYYMAQHVAIANLRGLEVAQDILAIHASKQKVAAYAFEDGNLRLQWYWITDTDGYASGHFAYPYDLDGDGRDEVIAGVDVLDENGIRLWQMDLYPFNPEHPEWGMDHSDSLTCADIDPDNPGKEIIVTAATGVWMYTATGDVLWHYPSKLTDPVNGIFEGEGIQEVLVGNFRDDLPGLELVLYAELMSGEMTVALFDKDGNAQVWGDQAFGPRRLVTFAMDWDGDRSLDEIYSRTGIFDGRLNKISEAMNYAYRQTTGDPDQFPPLVSDVQGDHREEILWYDTDEILILYNPSPLSVEQLPSPWTEYAYQFRNANNNHSNAYYLDWSVLGRPECMLGDLNDDGRLDVLDLQSMVNAILEGSADNLCADMDGSGSVEQGDVEVLVGKILGW